MKSAAWLALSFIAIAVHAERPTQLLSRLLPELNKPTFVGYPVKKTSAPLNLPLASSGTFV